MCINQFNINVGEKKWRRKSIQNFSVAFFSTLICLSIVFSFVPLLCHSKKAASRSDLLVISKSDFSKVKNRDKVHIIYAHKKTDESNKFISGELESVAKRLKGMINVRVVDCTDWSQYCKERMVQKVPALIIYPLTAQPVYQYKGKMNQMDIINAVLPLIPNEGVRILTKENWKLFVSEDVVIPKVILFSNKKTSPAFFNALANSFYKKRTFMMGYVDGKNENNTSILKNYKVKELPHLLVIDYNHGIKSYESKLNLEEQSKLNLKEQSKLNLKNLEIANGDFDDLYNWVNIFNQAFVSESTSPQEPKPWLAQSIPEMTKFSSGDICFRKQKKGYCVIYLKKGEIEEEEIKMLEDLKEKISSIPLSPQFHWVWMNMEIEKNFNEFLNITNYPSVVFFKTDMKRYAKLDTNKIATKETIESFIENFGTTFVKVSKFPIMAEREEKQDAKKSSAKEEL